MKAANEVIFTPQYQYDRIMSYAMEKNAIIPAQGSQCYRLLKAMFDGERLTVKDALERYGVYALSQRCGELIRDEWPVRSEWVKVDSGKKIKRYWLEA